MYAAHYKEKSIMLGDLYKTKCQQLIDCATTLADSAIVRMMSDGYLYAEIQNANFSKILHEKLLSIGLEDDIYLPDSKNIYPHISLAYPEERIKLSDAEQFVDNEINFEVLSLEFKDIELKRYYILTISSNEAVIIRKSLGLPIFVVLP